MNQAENRISWFSIFALLFFIVGCDPQSEPTVVKIPEVRTVEVPVILPGEVETVRIPTIISVDKSVGIKSLPRAIAEGSNEIRHIGKSVAKVVAANGASGTGFFISKDGLFLTNEHVVPIGACIKRKCPGYKIVTGFHEEGTVRSYSDFEVLAHDDGEYDFALIKVNLAPGEVVDFLELDFQAIEFEEKWDGSEFVVLGHPGGASLRFAEARPFEYSGKSIRFQGVVIPGNSGGPLVNLGTGKVVGLVKQMRTMPVRDGSGSSYFENLNEATTLGELDKLIQQKAGASLLSVGATTEMKDLSRVAKEILVPDEDEFGSVLRRPASDLKVVSALSSFLRLIGSEHESAALKLMLKKSQKWSGPINIAVLGNLLDLSVAIGRPLKFESEDLSLVEGELVATPEAAGNYRHRILLNYFDIEKRTTLQQKCLAGVPFVAQAAMLAVYNCVSSRFSDGSNALAAYADWLVKQSGYSNMEELASVMAFLMMATPLDLDGALDRNAISEINKFVDTKGRDLEVVMRNDSYAVGLLLKQIGVGSFAETFGRD